MFSFCPTVETVGYDRNIGNSHLFALTPRLKPWGIKWEFVYIFLCR